MHDHSLNVLSVKFCCGYFMSIWGIVGLDLSEFGDCLVFSWVNNVLHMFWKVTVIFAV